MNMRRTVALGLALPRLVRVVWETAMAHARTSANAELSYEGLSFREPKRSGRMERRESLWRAGAFLTLVAWSIVGCGLCRDDVLAEVESPGGEYVAVVFERDCGAMASYVAHVRVKRRNAAFGLWNRSVLVMRHANDVVRVAWTSPSVLIVNLPEGEIVVQESRWKDVRIEYRQPARIP